MLCCVACISPCMCSIASIESIPDLDVRLKSIVIQSDAAKKKLEKVESGETAQKVNVVFVSARVC